MKQQNVKCYEKFKQSSGEVFNTRKKIEAMKHLMLYRSALALLVPIFNIYRI
jgi:hypothetical protein